MDHKMMNLNMRFIGTSQEQRDVSSQALHPPREGTPSISHSWELTVLIWKMGLSRGKTAGQSALEKKHGIWY